ncbi:trypsin-like serine peptidase [Enterococcus termitis]
MSILKKMSVCLGIFYFGIYSSSLVNAEEVSHNDNTIENLEIDEEFIQSLEGEIYSNTESLPNNGELIVELPEDIKNLDKNVIEPYTIFGPDDRSYVSNTSIFPYSAVCQLVMEYSNGTYVGTGNIINNNYVLTAGHNLYSTERREWAKSVTVIPGAYPVVYSVGTYFGKTTAKKMTVPSGWINNGQTKDDIGVVELRDAIGKNGFIWFNN